MTERANEPRCLACDRTDQEIPLVALEHRGARTWICPQHLPMLIHDPTRLAGKLPGAETMRPAEGHG